MKRKKTLLYLSLFIGMSLSAQQQDQVPEESAKLVKEAAAENASVFLELIPQGQEQDYGFENRSDFSRIKIEEPYQLYYMKYKENKLGFVEGNEWRVPVSVDGKYAALLTVSFHEGKAEVVDFGANVLAHKLQESDLLLKGNQRVLIRSTYLAHDYLTADFAGLYRSQDTNGFRELNMDSSQTLYQLNNGPAIPVSVNTLYIDTAAAISNIAE